MVGGLVAAILSFTAFAQTGSVDTMTDITTDTMAGRLSTEMVGVESQSDKSYPECVTARNPQRCEIRLRAMDTCKDKRGRDLRACIEDNMPPPDCSQHPDPQRCESMQAIRESCKGKVAAERKTCMGELATKKASKQVKQTKQTKQTTKRTKAKPTKKKASKTKATKAKTNKAKPAQKKTTDSGK